MSHGQSWVRVGSGAQRRSKRSRNVRAGNLINSTVSRPQIQFHIFHTGKQIVPLIFGSNMYGSVCVYFRNTDAWSFHCQDLYDYNEWEQALFSFVYKEYPMPWRQSAGSGWFSDLRWWLSLRLIYVLTLQVRTIYPSLITCLSCYKWKSRLGREREM